MERNARFHGLILVGTFPLMSEHGPFPPGHLNHATTLENEEGGRRKWLSMRNEDLRQELEEAQEELANWEDWYTQEHLPLLYPEDRRDPFAETNFTGLAPGGKNWTKLPRVRLGRSRLHSPQLSFKPFRPEELRCMNFGRLIFIHLQCWEVLPFLTIQRQWCIKFRVLRAQNVYTPLALNCQKGQHLAALEVYKNRSPIFPRNFRGISPFSVNFRAFFSRFFFLGRLLAAWSLQGCE